MPETDLYQRDFGSQRAAAKAAGLAQAALGLVSAVANRLADLDPLAPLARDIVRSMTEAGLTVYRCAPHAPGGTNVGHQQATNTAIAGILLALGYPAEPLRSRVAWLVTGHLDQNQGAVR